MNTCQWPKHAAAARMRGQANPVKLVASQCTPSRNYYMRRCRSKPVGAAAGQQQFDRLLTTPLPELMREAAAVRDQGHSRIITFSPKASPIAALSTALCLLEHLQQ